MANGTVELRDAGNQDFWSRLASFVAGAPVVVDRPKGSAHPRIPGLIYPLDYGYLPGRGP